MSILLKRRYRMSFKKRKQVVVSEGIGDTVGIPVYHAVDISPECNQDY